MADTHEDREVEAQTKPRSSGRGRAKGRKKKRTPKGSHSSKEQARRVLNACRELSRLILEEKGVESRDLVDVSPLAFPVRVDLAGSAKGEDVAALLEAFDRHMAHWVSGAARFRQGRIFCFFCDSMDCDHSGPKEHAETFCGYHPSGKPEWQPFTSLCIARGDARVDKLYENPPEIIAVVQHGAELEEGRAADFQNDERYLRLVGQVVAGLVPRDLVTRSVRTERGALTLQVLETRYGSEGPRLRLNVLGLSGEEIADAAGIGHDRGPAEALRRTIQTTRRQVASLGRRVGRDEQSGQSVQAGRLHLDKESHGLLMRLRGDVERVFRPVGRRTRHAQARHLGGQRPTGRAMDDVAHANAEQFFRDVKKNTMIVLGGKGRVHVFSLEGRHVTSLRMELSERSRKQERGRWKPMPKDAIAEFREQLESIQSKREKPGS